MNWKIISERRLRETQSETRGKRGTTHVVIIRFAVIRTGVCVRRSVRTLRSAEEDDLRPAALVRFLRGVAAAEDESMTLPLTFTLPVPVESVADEPARRRPQETQRDECQLRGSDEARQG